jgi:hypothetical protein
MKIHGPELVPWKILGIFLLIFLKQYPIADDSEQSGTLFTDQFRFLGAQVGPACTL